MRRLIEGGAYSEAALIRVNTVGSKLPINNDNVIQRAQLFNADLSQSRPQSPRAWEPRLLVPRFFVHTRELQFHKQNMADDLENLVVLLCSRDLDKNNCV